MIKVDMTSPDLDRQIELLKLYPEVMEKHFKPTLYRAVKGMESRILPTIPMRTGRAVETFGSKVTGKGINLTGRVGWYDKNDPIYPNILEYGAKEHDIVPRGANRPTYSRFKSGKAASGFLRFPSTAQGGDFAFIRSAHHPGISAIGFMAAGFSAMQPVINALLAQANEGVVKDLALDQ